MPWLTGDLIPLDTVCRVIRLPNDPAFITAVNGALLDLCYSYNWEQLGDLTPDEVANKFDEIYIEYAASECIEPVSVQYPHSFMAFGFQGRVVTGSALDSIFLPSGMFTHYTRQSTAANGNEWEIPVLLAAGEWRFGYIAVANNQSGIIRFRFDGTDTAQVNDFYSVAQVLNVEQPVVSTIDVLTDGVHTVGWQVEGKNTSSSNYNCWIQGVWGLRVGDL